MPSKDRWQQRFQNFDRAIVLLREPIERGVETLSALEKEGTVQRFEFAVELRAICDRYMAALEALHGWLLSRRVSE